jgi:flagellar biogenesis protein FliO
MKKLIFAFPILFLFFSQNPSYGLDLSTYNRLENLETVSSERDIKIVLTFSKPILKFRKPQFFEKSIQFIFYKTYMSPAKKKILVDEELITAINAYQYDKNNVWLRLITGKKNSPLKDKLAYEITANKLEINISKKVAAANENNISYKNIAPAMVNYLGNENSDSIEPFSETGKAEGATVNRTQKTENSIFSPMVKPDHFSLLYRDSEKLMLIFLFMLILFFFTKKYFTREDPLSQLNKHVHLISSSNIAPKKNITIAEIAGEVLVFGVTTNNISLLTKIKDEKTLEKIKRMKKASLTSSPRAFFAPSLKNKKSAPIKGNPAYSGFIKSRDKGSSKEKDSGKKTNSVAALNDLIQKRIVQLKALPKDLKEESYGKSGQYLYSYAR